MPNPITHINQIHVSILQFHYKKLGWDVQRIARHFNLTVKQVEAHVERTDIPRIEAVKPLTDTPSPAITDAQRVKRRPYQQPALSGTAEDIDNCES